LSFEKDIAIKVMATEINPIDTKLFAKGNELCLNSPPIHNIAIEI
jgi:NADPH:quinone reductase-like Zn-dependent oxidoreductase